MLLPVYTFSSSRFEYVASINLYIHGDLGTIKLSVMLQYKNYIETELVIRYIYKCCRLIYVIAVWKLKYAVYFPFNLPNRFKLSDL